MNNLKQIISKKKKLIAIISILISLPLSLCFLFTPNLHNASVRLAVFQNPYSFAQEKSANSVENLLNISSIYDPVILSKMILDNPVLNEVIKKNDLRDNSGSLIEPANLRDKVKVKAISNNKKIQIEVFFKSQNDAKNIADSIAENFLLWRKKIISKQLNDIAAFIDNQTEKNIKKQKYASTKIEKLKKSKKLFGLKKDVLGNINKQALLEIEKINILLKQNRLKLYPTDLEDEVLYLRGKQKTIENALLKYRAELSSLPKNLVQRAELIKDDIISKKILKLLKNKSVEINILVNTLDTSIIIESKAKSNPRLPFIYKLVDVLGSIILGILVSIMIALILNYVDERKKTFDGIYLGHKKEQ